MRRAIVFAAVGAGTSVGVHMFLAWMFSSASSRFGSCLSPLLRAALLFLLVYLFVRIFSSPSKRELVGVITGVAIVHAVIALSQPSNLWPVVLLLLIVVAVIPAWGGGVLARRRRFRR